MDFDLPETALAVRDGVAAVAARYDNAYWSRCEEEHRFPQEVFDELGAGGWFGLCVPEQYGGGGQGLLELAYAAGLRAEELVNLDVKNLDADAEEGVADTAVQVEVFVDGGSLEGPCDR